MEKKHNINTLYPVILSVPPDYEKLKMRAKVRFLSQYARQALIISEQLSFNSRNIDNCLQTSGTLPKDENSAPMPVNGCFWSVTHKPAYAGGVVSCKPAGFDIEKIKEYTKGLRRKIADNKEWSLVDPEKLESFFRYWTAKEAVLKAAGVGLSELSKCRIAGIIDDFHLKILFKNQIWIAEHFYFNDHMASIVKNDFQVIWKKPVVSLWLNSC
ncbi:4'-phosphopantetheinyl transferase domain-containing protein [Desulfonema limicola]|uniref:4'-phosphopantetheinyl transferase domain-containing protein n=1 Tax=Desulfonema limicola TaxID=45656 RepID=A0A975B8M5_9BACT|nr:4'-phosphopantetheinyl transferase superfamily protein [Desulfonema limicola]QTA80814.1 4'-phosphopantetheinyl transferase domain-containing protein [Desulfonema limicola]